MELSQTKREVVSCAPAAYQGVEQLAANALGLYY